MFNIKLYHIINLLLFFVFSKEINANLIKDPTRPTYSRVEVPSENKSSESYNSENSNDRKIMILRAITYTNEKNKRNAIINNKKVKEGSNIYGAKVTSIRKNSVILKKNGKIIEIDLLPKIKLKTEIYK